MLIAAVDIPGPDGLSVAKKAREAPAAIRMVLISAHEAQLERDPDVKGGNPETLSKPFALKGLQAKVAKASG